MSETTDVLDTIRDGIGTSFTELFSDPELRASAIASFDRTIEAAKRISNLERNPPANHVRLPDGRDVPVLGTLPMAADSRLVFHDATVDAMYLPHPNGADAVRISWDHIKEHCYEMIGEYHTTEESARQAAEKARNP